MNNSDPTDDVLAAIASIFDKTDAPLAAAHPDDQHPSDTDENASSEPANRDKAPRNADGYSRLGPGPLDAIRFKWTARRDEAGDFYVDETIGEQSRAVTKGPMAEEDVIAFIDARESEARERFDRLKDDMTVRSPAETRARDDVERAHVEHVASEDQGF